MELVYCHMCPPEGRRAGGKEAAEPEEHHV